VKIDRWVEWYDCDGWVFANVMELEQLCRDYAVLLDQAGATAKAEGVRAVADMLGKLASSEVEVR
jgi:hypothetical protein